MVDGPERLEQRLAEGEELSPGEVAALLRVGRTTVHDMLTSGKIRYTLTPGGHRRCHPEDVRKALAERRRVRTGPDASASEPSG